MKKIVSIIIMIMVSLLLSGCLSTGLTQLDVNKPLDKRKGIIVGQISEGFITQPHNLWVVIKSTSKENKTSILLETFDSPDENERKNILSHRFIYELPEGEYSIYRWRYKYYKGMSILQKEPIKFTIKANEVSYIGDLHGISLTMCLSNYDNYEKEVIKLKQKYPILKNREIINKAKFINFKGWEHENSVDLNGNGKCK
jgi:hypothetical protein